MRNVVSPSKLIVCRKYARIIAMMNWLAWLFGTKVPNVDLVRNTRKVNGGPTMKRTASRAATRNIGALISITQNVR